MPTFKVTLAYDGANFVGWQRQASGVSVQGLVEGALRELDGRDVVVHGAGRTDAGVHALGQVASFTLDRPIASEVLLRAVNARFPDSVRIVAADEVPVSFHARFAATGKRYRYRIWNADLSSPFERAYAWHVPGALDIEAMLEAATLLEGRHDFAAFQAAGSPTRSSEREVFSSAMLVDRQAPIFLDGLGDVAVTGKAAAGAKPGSGEASALRRLGALVEYEVAGSGFLRHMVRNIVGSLVEIGHRRRSVDWMRTVLNGRDRTLAGPTAPPHGLVLVSVQYGARSLAAER
jgi:tRNA pseudouridine38-40 synthase